MATEPDAFVPAPQISPKLRERTGDRGPGYRKLVQLANDGIISPPMLRRGRFLGCYESRLPELATLLGLPMRTPTA